MTTHPDELRSSAARTSRRRVLQQAAALGAGG